MRLLRAAFEAKDTNVVWMHVLCGGCYHAFLQKLDGTTARHWAKEHRGPGMCDFCLEEARRAAVE